MNFPTGMHTCNANDNNIKEKDKRKNKYKRMQNYR